MCVIQNLTVHNCTTYSIHNLQYNIKETAEYEKSYIHLFLDVVDTRRECDALGIIENGKIVYYKYGEIERMVRKMGMFIEHVCDDIEKESDSNEDDENVTANGFDKTINDGLNGMKGGKNGEDRICEHECSAGRLSQKRSYVGIFINNCIEWTITDLSLILTNKISTTIYATFGKDNVRGIIEQGNVKVVVAGVKEIEMLRGIECLKVVIVVGKERGIEIEGVKVYYYDDVMNGIHKHSGREDIAGTDYAHKYGMGYSTRNYAHKCVNEKESVICAEPHDATQRLKRPPLPASADEITTIIYSSGTTGTPKPIPLSHRNIYTSIFALKYGRSTNKFVGINAGDHHLSFLPLAHVMERLLIYCFLLINVKVVFYSGDRKKLMDDIRLVRPTIFCGAPRLWEVVRDGIYSKLGVISRLLFKFLLFVKRTNVLNGVYTHDIADFLAFNRVKHMFGGRVRLLFSGSAFLDKDLKIFMESVLGVPMYEAYGLTETTGGVTTSTDKSGVGWPLFSDEIRIVDGELVVKGDNVSTRLDDENYYGDDDDVWKGWIEQEQKAYEQNVKDGRVNIGEYGKNEAESDDNTCGVGDDGRSNSDENSKRKDDGKDKMNDDKGGVSGAGLFRSTKWFRTGDNAVVVDGNVHIISRLKNNFKTIQGEYIVPERIEKVFKSMCTTFTDIFIAGDTKHSFVVALVVSEYTPEEVQDEIQKIARLKKKEGNLFGFEVPRHVHLVRSKFCDIEGCITVSTGKLCRKGVERAFRKEIGEMMTRG